MNIDLKRVVEQISPGFVAKCPDFVTSAAVRLLGKIAHMQEIQTFFEKYGHTVNWEFIDAVFEYLDFRYHVSDEDMDKIPSRGSLMCVSNHPLGILDGLSLLKTIGTVRRNVKIVVSDILSPVKNLNDLFLVYDLYSPAMQKKNLEKIKESLIEEEAIIFFPAGGVAKLTARGIREGQWRKGPVLFATKYGVPVLPVYVHANNSVFYYILTLIMPRYSTLLLPHEMFKKKSQSIAISIGDPISIGGSGLQSIDVVTKTEALKNKVLDLGKKR